MTEPLDGPGAVFVVRAWFESAAAESSFRARVTQAVDARRPGCSVVLTDPAEVMDALRTWMREFHRTHGIDTG